MQEKDKELMSMKMKVKSLEDMRKYQEAGPNTLQEGEGARQYMQQLELTIMNLKSQVNETNQLSTLKDDQLC